MFSLCLSLLSPWSQVVRVRPNDKDAKLKYQECNKIVKQKAFERAIASDEIRKSVVDSLDIENMSKFLFFTGLIHKNKFFLIIDVMFHVKQELRIT